MTNTFIFSAFIYTMPGYNCSIKERMLYSSCRNAVVESLEIDGIQIVKKVRINQFSCQFCSFGISLFFHRLKLILATNSRKNSSWKNYIPRKISQKRNLPSPNLLVVETVVLQSQCRKSNKSFNLYYYYICFSLI